MRNLNGRYDQGDVYNKIKRQGVISTQSYLRFEKSIQGSFNSVAFDILTNQGSANPCERRLQITDTFTITSLAFFIYKAGTTTTATDAQKAASVLRTWPNPQTFSGSGESAALETLYNGFVQIRVNTTVFVDSLDMRSFYRVHTSQTNVGSSAASNVPVQSDEWPMINNGFKKIVPTITLNGAAKNDIVVNLPASTSLIGTSSENFLVCYARGFLNQNAAQLNPGL